MRYEEFLKFLAHQAGIIMRKHFDPAGVPFDLKSDLTPVTIADRSISMFVREAVAEQYPEATLITEESDFPCRTQEGGVEYVIDELDGTNAFSRGVAAAVTAMAMLENFVPQVAVIHAPLGVKPATYCAGLGGGATLNGKPIRVSSRTVPRVAIATAGSPTEKFAAWPLATELVTSLGWQVETVHSISLSCAMLAAGQLEVVLFPWGTLHDTVMGDLLVREAGGVTSDLNGRKLTYEGREIDGFIMANNHENHRVALEVVNKYRR